MMFRRFWQFIGGLVERLPANPFIRFIALILASFAALTGAVKGYKELFPPEPKPLQPILVRIEAPQATQQSAPQAFPQPAAIQPQTPAQSTFGDPSGPQTQPQRMSTRTAPSSVASQHLSSPEQTKIESAHERAAIVGPLRWKNPALPVTEKEVAPVGYCLWEIDGVEYDCGQNAADRFCKSVERTRASAFSYRSVTDQYQFVYFYGSNIYSASVQYRPKTIYFHALTDVTCE